MLYDYNTEYTTKHSTKCYDVDIKSTWKIWLSFNKSKVYQFSWPNGIKRYWLLNPRVMSLSPAMGKHFLFCNSLFALLAARVSPSKLNQPYHTPSQYHVLDKSSIDKKWLSSAVHVVYHCSSKLSCWFCNVFLSCNSQQSIIGLDTRT